MRKRMIDPEFWLDEGLAKMTPHARLLYIGLWSLCDDNYATFPNRPLWVKAQVFPYDDVEIESLLAELEAGGKIIPFEHETNKYYFVKNFFKYQRVDRPSSPKYPEYPNIVKEDSASTRSEVKLSKAKVSKAKVTAQTEFEQFWLEYPRKIAKQNALKSWNKIAPTPELAQKIIFSVSVQKTTPQWKKDGGQFIPHPATWLNQGRWEDEVTADTGRRKVDKF